MSRLLYSISILSVVTLAAACSPHQESHSHAQPSPQHHAHQATAVVDMSTLPEGLTLSDARIRAAFSGATTGAAYVTINNNTEDDVHLTSVSVSEDIAMKVEIHDMRMEGEMMQMFELEDGVIIPAKSQLQLRPGGKHIMLMGLATELSEGKSLEMTLQFAQHPAQTVLVPVVRM